DPDPLVFLCQNEAGYANLLKLVSKAYLDGEAGEPPQVSLADLTTYGDGLLCLTGGAAGPIGRLLAEGQSDKADACLQSLVKAFPGRLYVELQGHGMEVEERIEGALADLAYAHDLPLVATNDPFFAVRDMCEAHDARMCI